MGAQCNEITRQFEQHPREFPTLPLISTVVSSQGSERDIVILSTVRSKPLSAIEKEPNIQWRRTNIGS